VRREKKTSHGKQEKGGGREGRKKEQTKRGGNGREG